MPVVRTPWPLRGAAVVALLALAGCSDGYHRVTGKVVWADGTPATELSGGFVGFSSEATNISATGAIQADGTFILSSRKENDGLPPGTYQVMVSAPEEIVEEFDANGKPRTLMKGPTPVMPEKYANYRTSGLTATVEAKSNEVTLKLEKQAARKK